MKKLILLALVLSLTSCQDSFKEPENYYSTKVDTTYSSVDRTVITGISRKIYAKRYPNNSKKYRAVSLSLYLKDNTLSILERDESYTYRGIWFKNKEELIDFFSKVDSLKLGQELNERKKTVHYEISKKEKKQYGRDIKVRQFLSHGKYDIELSNEEYFGIKEAYTKFMNESN